MIRLVLSFLLLFLIIVTIFHPFDDQVQMLIMLGSAVFLAGFMFRMAYVKENDK